MSWPFPGISSRFHNISYIHNSHCICCRQWLSDRKHVCLVCSCSYAEDLMPNSLLLSLSHPLSLCREEGMWCHACLPSAVKPSNTHTHTHIIYNCIHDSWDTSPSLSIMKLLRHVTVYNTEGKIYDIYHRCTHMNNEKATVILWICPHKITSTVISENCPLMFPPGDFPRFFSYNEPIQRFQTPWNHE